MRNVIDRQYRGLALVAFASLAVLGGCGRGAGGDEVIQLKDGGPAVAVVNGQEVPQRLLDAVARAHNWDMSKPELRDRALRELANYIIAAQAAHEGQFSGDPDFAARAELDRLQSVSAAAMAEFQKRAQIDDSVLRAEYDKQVVKAGSDEYDFGHIVFATEPEAIKAAGEVLGGKPFDTVLEAHKKDARQARQFTHIRGAQLPQPIAQALTTMKPGETSKVPVQSSFGWHVLHLTAVKPYTPPAFDQVKENLRRTLVKHAGEERLRTLREQAKATLMTPSGPVEWSVIPKPPAPGQVAPAGAPKVITPGPAAAKPAPQPPSGADQPDKPKGGS